MVLICIRYCFVKYYYIIIETKLIKCFNNLASCFIEIVRKHSFSNHVHQMHVKLELIFVFTYHQRESYSTTRIVEIKWLNLHWTSMGFKVACKVQVHIHVHISSAWVVLHEDRGNKWLIWHWTPTGFQPMDHVDD